MPRSKTSKTKHDYTVRREAQSLKKQGYDVEADVRGYPKPDTIRGYRPDVVARRGRERQIVEVETPDSVDSARDLAQRRAFRQAADQSKSTTFRRKLAD